MEKKHIIRDSGRLVLRKLRIQSINKNPNVEREHFINKIKKHERLYTVCLSSIILVILLGISIMIGRNYRNILYLNTYDSANLLVDYSSYKNVIGDVVTLTDEDIQDDILASEKQTHRFTITNKSNKATKYLIVFVRDNEFIKLDNCGDRLFNEESIRFNINNGTIYSLEDKNVNHNYILEEDVIPANSTKMYNINMWVNKITSKTDRHYHGKIQIIEEK